MSNVPDAASARLPPAAGVTVVADFLRPDGKGHPGGADRPAAWLHAAIRRQIGMASGLDVQLMTPTAVPALAAWVSSMRGPSEADRLWAAAYEQLPDCVLSADALQSLILLPLKQRICVGYEMPPYLVRLLDRHSIPYVDIRIHPIRFMDDLMFAVRASHPDAQAALSLLGVAESEVVITAGLREAMCRLISDATIPDDTLLVLGQRPHDASQIADGTFFDAMKQQTEIASICARHTGVLLKPHPQERQHSLMTVAAGVASNVLGVVDDNLYRLLAMPQVSAVLSVSSSAAIEARYFGKNVYTLGNAGLCLGWRGTEMAPDMHAAVDETMFSVDFWRHMLTPYGTISAFDGVRLAPKPNRLRIALDSFWNFNEIDTDRIPVGRSR